MLVALFSVVIGATVFLGMGAVYYDIPRQMGREFRSYGANLILVSSGAESILNQEEIKQAIDLIPADKLVGASSFRYATMYYNRQRITVVGADFAAVQKTSPYWQIQGAWPQDADEILIGADIAEHARQNAGSLITLEVAPEQGRKFRKEMRVSGVLRTGGAEDAFVLMPMTGLEALMGATGTANVVELSIAAANEEISGLIEQIQAQVQGVSPRLVKRIAASEGTVLSRLQALVYLVTGVVLILTMICVGTTMMTVVMERRKEIALKKALGAENKALMAEFVGEGVCLALCGWLFGLGTGYLFAQLVSMSVFARGVTLPFFLAVLALLASLAVTLLASLIPMAMATDVEPALILRGE
ncbi:MAG: ABC transporter permease [Deltaproteobacteria bacterium]|jgi:putative ABC transport system permease protein|nr:ABC transporter permease [Deltaproteobacteria bacterium]